MEPKANNGSPKAEGRSNEDESSETIIMQGWLEKKSDHLKKWRKRWTIIIQRGNQYFIETYKKITLFNYNINHNSNSTTNRPTATINIDENLEITPNEYNDNDNSSGFIINVQLTKSSFEFKIYSIYNHTINDWINCIERIKYKQYPKIKTNDMIINRINNNQSLKSKYIFTSGSSSKCLIYDHWKYIFLYFQRIYFAKVNDNGKLIKLVISYTNLEHVQQQQQQQHSENNNNNNNEEKEMECFKWMRNLSILQNTSTQRYYTPTIVYDTFNENNGSENAGYYFDDNLFVDADYFPFNKTNYQYDQKYFSIFRIGGGYMFESELDANKRNNIYDLLMINKNQLNVKNNFNDQDMDLFYHQFNTNLGPKDVNGNLVNPSVIYHNNHLFAVGGYLNDNEDEDDPIIDPQKDALKDIYCLDLSKYGNEWQCVTNKVKLQKGKFGSTLTFLNGNRLMIISGYDKTDILSKTVELYQFEGNEYILDINNNKNKNIKNKSILLNNTKCTHCNAGIVKEIGYDFNKLCIGSNNNVEIYDGYKDEWLLFKNNTNKMHITPRLWTDHLDKNIIYIGSQNGVEWCDIRNGEGKSWTIIENNNNDIKNSYKNVQIV